MLLSPRGTERIVSSAANIPTTGPSGRSCARARNSENEMKVLITGGGGFIGSHLAEGHLKRGDQVWSVDTGMNLKVRHLLDNPRFHYVKASVLDEGAMEAFVLRADLVYHHAAVVAVEAYVDDPFNVLNVNILGTLNLLRLAHRHGKRLV